MIYTRSDDDGESASDVKSFRLIEKRADTAGRKSTAIGQKAADASTDVGYGLFTGGQQNQTTTNIENGSGTTGNAQPALIVVSRTIINNGWRALNKLI